MMTKVKTKWLFLSFTFLVLSPISLIASACGSTKVDFTSSQSNKKQDIDKVLSDNEKEILAIKNNLNTFINSIKLKNTIEIQVFKNEWEKLRSKVKNYLDLFQELYNNNFIVYDQNSFQKLQQLKSNFVLQFFKPAFVLSGEQLVPFPANDYYSISERTFFMKKNSFALRAVILFKHFNHFDPVIDEMIYLNFDPSEKQ